jgi:hypothetical protein
MDLKRTNIFCLQIHEIHDFYKEFHFITIIRDFRVGELSNFFLI